MCFNVVSATYSHKPRFELLPCPASCLSDDTVLSFVLPYQMNGPGEEKRNLRLLTQVSKRLLSNRRRAGDLADRSGIEPDSHGLTVRPHTFVRFGHYLVPDSGFEPLTKRLSVVCSTSELIWYNGVSGQIRTGGFTILQTVALDLSATDTLIGADTEIRIRTFSLED